ncbi:MAG: hypothetical protein IPP90_23295 [Gemmatimonadaceae bacterium]|nr:hypothetical protein [Gemmatimonadaceae bacterium]
MIGWPFELCVGVQRTVACGVSGVAAVAAEPPHAASQHTSAAIIDAILFRAQRCEHVPESRASMSRAFLRDDAEGEMPRRNYNLPEREDPEFNRVAARAMLEAARVGETQLAERATGYYWGEPVLKPYVQELLAEAERKKDDRMEQLARRFLS